MKRDPFGISILCCNYVFCIDLTCPFPFADKSVDDANVTGNSLICLGVWH